MSETNDNVTSLEMSRKLAEAVRAVKNAAADRDDVVVDMRDAERMRLELLANELAPVIAEVPDDIDIFDFAISSGLQPRFWVDGVAHVAMGRDKRSYRFVKDTRNGRVILAESPDLRPVADTVTRYVAERIVERERLMEGGAPIPYRATRDIESAGQIANGSSAATGMPVAHNADTPNDILSPAIETQPETGWKALLWGIAIFLLGAAFGFSIMATQWWDEISRRVSGS